WKHAVDVVMHFNDMSSRSRRLGLTFVAAVLSLSIFFLKSEEKSSIEFSVLEFELTVHISFLLSIFAALSINVVKVLDIGVYHSMLRGAVTFGEDIENLLRRDILPLQKGLMQSISHFSRYSDAKAQISESGDNYEYSGEIYRTAEKKLLAFYRRTAITLYAISLMLLLSTTTLSKVEQASPVKPVQNMSDPSSKSESEISNKKIEAGAKASPEIRSMEVEQETKAPNTSGAGVVENN
ncbi:MAG: hypothetical protein AB2708_21060, partial [Candidatus Thiodiazotropha taylori]